MSQSSIEAMPREDLDNHLLRIGSVEISLRQSEELFQAYIEAANDMVYTVDLAGRLTFVNSYGQRLLGCSESEIVGKSYLDFVVPEHRARTEKAFAALVHTGELRDFEFVLKPQNGPEVYLEVNGKLLYRRGELIGGIGIGRDITERKRIEKQLQMFSRAVESAYDSAIITDLHGQVMYANPAAGRIFRWAPESLHGQNASILYLDQEQIEWLIQQAIAGGWSGEVICQRRDGERFPVLVSVGPICNEAGQPTAVSFISRDITEQKAIQAELAAKNLELERANRLKSEFLANMSHELRTPLTSILGFSSLLKQQIFGQLNDKQALYANQIHQSGQHLLSLINDVLDLSKVEAGQMVLDIAPVSIQDLCQGAVNLVSEQARSKGLQVNLSIQPQLDYLMADEVRVRQMLLNLLSNAIKFSKESGEIGLDVKAQGGYLRMTVWDQGIGIPEGKQHLLFQPFQQIDGSLSRKHEGTGLGLALTRRLAELHSGTVEFQSTEGVGSQFIICLPLHQQQVPFLTETDSVTSPAVAPPAPLSSQVGSILLIEDNPLNATLLQDILSHWGYEVYHAIDGWQALELLKTQAIDLILLDIQLPEMDGFEVANRVRANANWQAIPIIATTALAMAGDRDRCLAAGLQDYISKPINYEELASLLKQYMRFVPS